MLSNEDIQFFVQKILGLDPKKTKITIDEIEQLLFPRKNMKIVGVYGKGAFGLVLKTRYTDDIKEQGETPNYALRLSRFFKDKDRSVYEYKIQQTFAEYNMAPKIYHYDVLNTKWQDNNISIVRAVMDPIYDTLNSYLKRGKDIKLLYEPFECLLKKKFLLNYPDPYLHGDTHTENIVLLRDGKTLGFIDFGWSVKAPYLLQILDGIPLITSLKIYFPETKNTLIAHLLQFYDEFFNVKLNYSQFTNHPLGGFTYKVGNQFLHSYNWGVQKIPSVTGITRYEGLPFESALYNIFPKIDPPKVVD